MLPTSKSQIGCVQCSLWESEIDSIYKSIGVPLDSETVDIACSEALEKIAQLKYIAIEIAAHCECQCSDGSGDCLYCIARRLTHQGIKWTDIDESHFRDVMMEASIAREKGAI